VTIRAPGASDRRRYVDRLRIDGKPLGRNWVGHAELLRGATLEFTMSAEPNLHRGTAPGDAPYSFSTDQQ
jgi:putative alpha-1,2-mannosidase